MIAGERRRKRRFSIEASLEFVVTAKDLFPVQGTGVSENISSNGLLFRSGVLLAPGVPIKVELQWPAAVPSQRATRLYMSGRVVRASGTQVAVEVGAHDFRNERGIIEKSAGQDSGTPRPVVLIVGAEPLYETVQGMLSRYHYPFIRITAEGAQNVLATQQSLPFIMITDELETLAQFRGRVALVYTGPENHVVAGDPTVVLPPTSLSTKSLRVALESLIRGFAGAGSPVPETAFRELT